MPYTVEGGTKYTVVNGEIVPASQKPTVSSTPAQVGGKSIDVRDGSTESYLGAPSAPPPPTTGASAPASPTDYSQTLGIYGLPPDVQNKVNAIFAQTGDVNQATALAMAYIRGTSWYDQTYPGIKEGLANGTVSNEADYRNYLNNVNTLSKQYLGRDVSGQEISGYLQQGYTADRVGRIYQGGAISSVNGADWNQVTGSYGEGGQLNDQEQQALGQEQAGIDTLLGQKVQRRLALAQQRLQTVFSGDTAKLSLTGDRIRTSLSSGDQPDVAS